MSLTSNTIMLMIAIIVTTLAVGPTLSMSHTVKAVESSLSCSSPPHTKNYCDGFTIGKTDCRDGKRYNGNDPTHTKDWQGGYKAGWTGAGCHVP
jgi:hypothetical protein